MNLRLLHDWLLIELEPAPKQKGSIIVPDSVPEPVRIGKVLTAGPGRRWGKKFVPVTVEKGERVVFFKAVTDSGQNKAVSYCLPDNQEIIRETDVLFAVEGDVEVSV